MCKEGVRLRVLIVQPRLILRDGLDALLGSQPDMQVVGAVPDTMTAEVLMLALRPSVVVTDLVVGGASGCGWISDMRARHPDTHIVVLASHRREECVRAALTAGACGYVTKDSDSDELAAAIRAVGAGRHYLCRGVTGRMVERFVRPRRCHAAEGSGHPITPREREVLLRIAQGGTSAGIALELDVDVRTVERHRANLMRKLAVHSAAELRRLAEQCNAPIGTASSPDANAGAPANGDAPLSPRR